MLVIGHRGAMGYASENTLLSIRKAIELGADWVEIDVYLVEEQLIVIHDETVDRTTNGRGKLTDFKVEQLSRLDAGSGESVPTLLEVFDLTEGKLGLNIELKGAGTGVAVVDFFSSTKQKYKDDVLISSFVVSELEDVFNLGSTLKIGVLAGKDVKASLVLALELKAVSLHLSKKQVTQEWVDTAHQQKLKLYVYTLNKAGEIRRMKSLGVDGVFSNYPDRVVAVCGDV